jgi:hypothetical protein
MSATLIHPIAPDSSVSLEGRSIANAFRGTAAIRLPVIDKFGREDRHAYIAQISRAINPDGDLARSAFMGHVELLDPDWLVRLSKREDVHPFVRSVLMTTFDGAVVRMEEIPRLILDMKQFDREFSDPRLPTNLAQQVDCLEGLANTEKIIGVCWNPWSGNVDAWRVVGDKQVERAYNLELDNEHFFIYDRIGSGD